jgi:bacterioferritin
VKGDKTVIKHLNTVLKNELTAINQYFLHSRMLNDWGVEKLGEKEYQESVEEMQHADLLIQRILFLEGVPNLQDLGKLAIGEDVREVLGCDLKMEYQAVKDAKAGVAAAQQVEDWPSYDLFRKIVDDEEGHIDWLETQLDLIERIGIENFTQSWVR